MSSSASPPSTRRVIQATLAALIVAGLLLVTVVLPAEYGVDPLGTGRALGLTALAGAGDGPAAAAPPATAASPSSAPAQVKQDRYVVELRPFEGVEFKYRLEGGRAIVYSWTATAPVEFEFHGEPDGAPANYFDSYEKSAGSHRNGSFTAAKPGVHGWYWKNTGEGRVTVTLTAAGFFSKATEYRDGERTERMFAGK